MLSYCWAAKHVAHLRLGPRRSRLCAFRSFSAGLPLATQHGDLSCCGHRGARVLVRLPVAHRRSRDDCPRPGLAGRVLHSRLSVLLQREPRFRARQAALGEEEGGKLGKVAWRMGRCLVPLTKHLASLPDSVTPGGRVAQSMQARLRAAACNEGNASPGTSDLVKVLPLSCEPTHDACAAPTLQHSAVHCSPIRLCQ